MDGKTVTIKYDNLYVTGYVGKEGEEEEIRLPIKNIPEMEEAEWQHIHGHLRITIRDKKIWDLGYFGEDDVCFNDWLSHLVGVIDCFSKSSQSRFLFYDGGQGDNAFEFCRDDSLVYISHIDTEIYYSILSEELFDSRPTYSEKDTHYSCDYTDFDLSARAFIEQVKKDIFSELGDFGSIWWQENIHADGRCSHIKQLNQYKKGIAQN